MKSSSVIGCGDASAAPEKISTDAAASPEALKTMVPQQAEESISNKNLKRLQEYPLEIIYCGKTSINISKLLRLLSGNGIKKILLEGGGTVNWSFIKKNLIDEAVVTLAPYIIGGKDTISLVEGSGFKNLEHSTKLKLKKIQKNKNELVLFYKL